MQMMAMKVTWSLPRVNLGRFFSNLEYRSFEAAWWV